MIGQFAVAMLAHVFLLGCGTFALAERGLTALRGKFHR